MTRVRTWAAAHKTIAILAVITSIVIAAAGAVGVAKATDAPAFCGSACHEMGPYHSAWAEGPHAKVACVECHVKPGEVNRLTHKVEAMKELWIHVSGEPTFPLEKTAVVPNDRCVRCHKNIKVSDTGFDHAKHATKGDCQSCHSTAGHEVTAAALKEAGVYNASATDDTLTTRVAVVDGGVANIVNHKQVSCSRCHDMAKTGCKSCHTPKHEGTGPAAKTAECVTCHAPGEQFVFAHPTDAPDCGSCHEPTTAKHDYNGECATCHNKPGQAWTFAHNPKADCTNCHASPAKHIDVQAACSTCHKTGVSWAFSHPRVADGCTSCHARPAQHRTGECTTCHKTGVSWAFDHPSRSASCTSCHPRPAQHNSGACTSCHGVGTSWAFRHPKSAACATCHARPAAHKTGSCTTCHRAGTTWAFRHPSSSATCTNCHNRPSGHRAGSCATCHRVGTSWAFRHPTSTACRNCHSSPANHYGTTCASCHSPSRAWSNATFSHARIPGGEHTYRSFACSNCHPNGYSSHTCAKCHDSSSGPSGD